VVAESGQPRELTGSGKRLQMLLYLAGKLPRSRGRWRLADGAFIGGMSDVTSGRRPMNRDQYRHQVDSVRSDIST
jgi:hypothetical protein